MDNVLSEYVQIMDREIRLVTASGRATKRPSRLARLSNIELEDLVAGGRVTDGDLKDLLKDGRPHLAARALIEAVRHDCDGRNARLLCQIVFCSLVRAASHDDRRDIKLVHNMSRALWDGCGDDEGNKAKSSHIIAAYALNFGFKGAYKILTRP